MTDLFKTSVCLFMMTFLTACDSPSLKFSSADARVFKTQVDGSSFSVHQLGNEVEVYRTSIERLPRASVILARSKIAVEKTTHCRVIDSFFKGDQAIQTGLIDCGEGNWVKNLSDKQLQAIYVRSQLTKP